MERSLYLECNSGISGDMMVAALLDLGADENVLYEVLDSLHVSGFKTEYKRVKKGGIDCGDFNVILDAEHENHDHDMEYLYGHEHEHSHEHHHEHEHEHHHESDHEHSHEHHHEHEHHHHEHRGLNEIIEIIDHGKMTENAREISKKIFTILAKSEAKAHDTTIENVHFHEVGAVDSIVDIIAVAVCIDNLNIKNVIVPKVCEGHGSVRCQHGILPVPVPAVANIISEYGIGLEFINERGEFVTPTGAAIIAALRTSEKLPGKMKINRIGIGAGKREYERANILRIMDITDDSKQCECNMQSQQKNLLSGENIIYKLESNIDDCTGENLGFVMEKLFAAGARDVHYHPVYMKKNRPAWQINVICTPDKIDCLERIIFKETTTIGIRRLKMERSVLERKMNVVSTEYGNADVKVCQLDDMVKYYPEYESVVKICNASGLSYVEAYNLVLNSI